MSTRNGFFLDEPDGYRYYSHKIGTDRRVFGKKEFSRRLTVWAGIGFGGTTTLYYTTETINNEKYQEIIQQHHLPFHQPRFLLAQDNAPCHVSAASRQFMAERNIALLDWAAHSPDCNPIENLWGIVVHHIYRNCHHYQNLTDLKSAIQLAWDEIELNTVQNLIASFPKRLIEVVKAKGGNISNF